MTRLLFVEIRKLSGSFALFLAFLVPLLPAVLVFLALLVSRDAPSWGVLFDRFTLPLWGLFLFPMGVAAFTTLLAQVEYRTHAWEHLLALPLRKWQVFFAKAVLAVGTAVLMTALVILFAWLAGLLGGAIRGRAPAGTVPWLHLARVAGTFLAASLTLVVIQLWTALRFANFAAPLAVGIAGTLVALAVTITGTSEADWFPWVLPAKMLVRPQAVPLPLSSFLTGLVLLTAMICDLSRRSFR